MSDEKELIFRRFPAEKQDQVRGLVEYAMLMGLNGRDLVSIGGKLDRLKLITEREQNIRTIESFGAVPTRPRTKAIRQCDLDYGFMITVGDCVYTFTPSNRVGNYWEITNSKNKRVIKYITNPYEYEIGKPHPGRRSRYSVLLDVAKGKLKLPY